MVFALGLLAGLRERRLLSRLAPAFVRVGNLERIMLSCAAFEWVGSRNVRALGRRLKPGQLSSVGIPQSSKICAYVNDGVQLSHLFFPAFREKAGGLTHL